MQPLHCYCTARARILSNLPGQAFKAHPAQKPHHRAHNKNNKVLSSFANEARSLSQQKRVGCCCGERWRAARINARAFLFRVRHPSCPRGGGRRHTRDTLARAAACLLLETKTKMLPRLVERRDRSHCATLIVLIQWRNNARCVPRIRDPQHALQN